jgi:choline-sulfatase
LWRLIENRGAGGERLFAYSESMEPSIQYGWSPLLGLRTTKYKFIDAPRKELYDLEKDPGELTDLHSTQARVTDDLEKTLKTLVTETSAGAPQADSANLDSETVERLAALGYIGSAVKTKTSDSTTILVDPKDRLPVHEAINQAGELNNNDQYAESAAVLEKVLKDDPHNPQARLLLATDYMEMKRSEDAASLLHGLLEEDPQNVRALTCLAKILQDDGKHEEVIQLCKKVLDVDDRNTQALTMIGQAYLDLHDFTEAKTWLEKAVAVQPKLTQNQLNLAACLIGLKKYDEAKQRLSTILEDNPKFPKAHYHMGILYEEQGSYSEAIREYEKEIEFYPTSFMARFNLGRLKLRSGDQEGYMEQMREVVKIAPKNAAGYLFLARGLLQENAELTEVLQLSEQGLSLARTPEYKAMGYFLLADIYNRKKQPEQMRQALLHANEYKSQIPN